MKLSKLATWVVVGLVIVAAGLGVGQIIKGQGSATSQTSPPTSGTLPTLSTGPSISAQVSLDPALAGPITLPKNMYVSVLYNSAFPTQATVVRYVEDAVRAERWRLYAIRTEQVGIEDLLQSSAGQFLDLEYGNLFGAELGKTAVVSGTPTYLQGYVVTLDKQDLLALQAMGMTTNPTYAVILLEQGPVTVQIAGGAVQTIIPAAPRELILTGRVVNSAQLGEIWQSDMVLGCRLNASGEVRIQSCTTTAG